MKPALVILAGLLIYQSANVIIEKKRVTDLEFQVQMLIKDNRHLKGQVQRANDQVLEWNGNFKCTDYANRNNLDTLSIIE